MTMSLSIHEEILPLYLKYFNCKCLFNFQGFMDPFESAAWQVTHYGFSSALSKTVS